MMTENSERHVEMVPVERIHVLNPRVRNQSQFLGIVDSIKKTGLRKPITVSRRTLADGTERFDLACGQGRLEAFKILGQKEIPAFVVNAAEEDCLVMSLVENIARRQYSPIELMQEVGQLRRRGHSDAEIAERIGSTPSWVNMIGSLLEKGEQRLVAAVETGTIPLSLAIEIAKSDDASAQTALADAYSKGYLTGKKIVAMRRILDRRAQAGKKVNANSLGKKGSSKQMSAEDLHRVYQREVDKQKALVKKSDYVQSTILFVAAALKELLQEEEFARLLHQEGNRSPRYGAVTKEGIAPLPQCA